MSSRTFIAVTHCIEVDIVVVVAKEHEAEPGVKAVDGHNEQYAHNPPLLVRTGVVAQVQVDLKQESFISIAGH